MIKTSNDTAETIRLISSAQGALLGYILSLCADRSTAQDILQETNVVLWRKVEQFQTGTNFKAWAFRIAYLQMLAHQKREKRECRIGFSTDLVEKLAVAAEPAFSDFEMRQAALRKCLEKLNRDDSAILQARYEERVPVEVIGASLHRSGGAIKRVLLRLRRTLKCCIERRVDGGLDGV